MKNLIVFDQKVLAENRVFEPFAFTDVLTEYAGTSNQNFLHFWQLPNFFILGMKDTRVNHLADGLRSIEKNDYQPVIRNSGGLGVIADAGILNVSLILPKDAQLSIDEGYEKLWHIVQKAFPSKKAIEAKEISDSYCPGKFDLSMDNLKFAGIAQRRIKQGVAVMMYLSVNGPQQKRGEIVREFYQTALKENFGKDGFPAVDPTCMQNLSSLLDKELTIPAVKEKILTATADNLQADILETTSEDFLKKNNQSAQFTEKLQSMQQRNALLKELADDNSL